MSPGQAPSNEDLVGAVRAGSDEAFGVLVRRHEEPLLRWFTRRGLDNHSARDCAQDTFVRLFRASGSYDRRAPFTAFLLRLARNTYVDWWRRQRRHVDGRVEQPDEVRLVAPPSSDLLDLRAAVDGLPDRLAAVVRLSTEHGLPYPQIADRLGIPVGTVKSRMYVAVRRLREALGDGVGDGVGDA